MDLVWAAEPTRDTDRPTLMAGLIPTYAEDRKIVLGRVSDPEKNIRDPDPT